MDAPNLLLVCLSAFLAVFLLLTVLAVLMRLITAVFPHRDDSADAAIIAAVSSTIASIYPGTKITKIEETR